MIGELYVNNSLSNLSSGIYKIWVEARDCGIRSLSSMAIISIHLSDTNNYAPQFIWPANNSGIIKISEVTEKFSINPIASFLAITLNLLML